MDTISLVVGFSIGAILVWLLAEYRRKSAGGIPRAEADALQRQLGDLGTANAKAEERNRGLVEALNKAEAELGGERGKVITLTGDLSAVRAEYSQLGERLQTQKQELEDIQKKFTEQFQTIADRILLDNSRALQQQHKDRLDEILTPLKDRIESFEKKVDDTHKENIRENQSLKEQIVTLQKLNQSIGEEAKNLTTALKGQSKTRGDWGEIILESILEKSGLVKGREYLIQEIMTNEEGKRFQPDVIINLPENKNLVIDSKVSLAAYERYCNAVDEPSRLLAQREHVASIRRHIRELGGKNYQHLYRLNSLDFVLMFIPIEAAFSEAVNADAALWNEAFERNIVIVTTSTLLATLRTIASIWRQENQNRNALEIAKRGGELYDKFVGFVEDLLDVGTRMKGAQQSYEEAMGKLVEGKGNLVRRAEAMKELGAKTSKSLPSRILDKADTEDLFGGL